MKKVILRSFLVLLLAVIGSLNSSAFIVNGFYYCVVSEKEGTCAVTSSSEELQTWLAGSWCGNVPPPKNCYSGDVVIPSQVTYNSKTYKVTEIANGAFLLCNGMTSISIPTSITRIGNYAFDGCDVLTSIDIPSSVTSIGDYAFSCCKGLTSIDIPANVASIGVYAFRESDGLTKITVDSKNPYFDSRDNCNAIINSSTNELAFGCKNSTIPNTVTGIGDDAFADCVGLTSIYIPSSVTIIKRGAFMHCEGLTSIDIPSSVTSIGNYAFVNCYGLTCVDVPASVTSIGYCAFGECSSLQCITLPSSLSNVDDGLFRNCDNLKYVIFPAEEVVAPDDDFYQSSFMSSATLYVPASLVNDYKSATGWKDFGTIAPIPSTADYSVYTKPFTARPGEKLILSVMMNNVNPITAWQADIKLPEGFTIAKDDADDDLVTVATDRTTEEAHSIITKQLADGKIRIMESSATNATFEGTAGKVATIVIDVAESVKEGDYFVEFFNVKLAEANAYATKHEVGTTVSTFSVIDYQDGDVDNDHNIDISDLVYVVNYIMERPAADCIDAAADVNKDGNVDGLDYIGEIDLVMNFGMAKQRNAVQSKSAGMGYLSSSYVNMHKGSYSTMNINLNGQGSKYSLIQFDITLPEGMAIAEDGASIIRTNSIKHDITIQHLRKNTYRVLMYSDSKANIREEADGVIALSLVADKDMDEGEYNALITGQLLVSGDGAYNKPRTASAKIVVVEPTSIDYVSSHDSLVDIYSADGVLVRKSANTSNATQGLAKGMYISNGKKMIVK